jgi:hypothetical protein
MENTIRKSSNIRRFNKSQKAQFLESIKLGKDCSINLGSEQWTFINHRFFNDFTLTKVTSGIPYIWNNKLKCWEDF